MMTSFDIIRFEKKISLLMTFEKTNSIDVEDEIDIADIDVDSEIDVIINIIVAEKSSAKKNVLLTENAVLQIASTATTATTNTKIIFLNQSNLCSRFDDRIINSIAFFF